MVAVAQSAVLSCHEVEVLDGDLGELRPAPDSEADARVEPYAASGPQLGLRLASGVLKRVADRARNPAIRTVAGLVSGRLDEVVAPGAPPTPEVPPASAAPAAQPSQCGGSQPDLLTPAQRELLRAQREQAEQLMAARRKQQRRPSSAACS